MLVTPKGWQPEYIAKVGEVQFRFPAVGKATGTKRRADPYVVAAALTFGSEWQPWAVVTGESRNGRAAHKIPASVTPSGLSV